LICENSLTQGNNDKYIIGGDCKDLYGIPRTILSDRGPQFMSKFMKDLTKALGTKQMLSTA